MCVLLLDKLHSKALYLQFKGRLVYSKTHSEVDAAVHDIWEMINSKRSLVEGNVAVGFDVEWKTSFRRGIFWKNHFSDSLCLHSTQLG